MDKVRWCLWKWLLLIKNSLSLIVLLSNLGVRCVWKRWRWIFKLQVTPADPGALPLWSWRSLPSEKMGQYCCIILMLKLFVVKRNYFKYYNCCFKCNIQCQHTNIFHSCVSVYSTLKINTTCLDLNFCEVYPMVTKLKSTE